MSLTGGKRKVNKGLKDWVTFVKKVQKEEKLSYKDAIHRAKVRKDKGEKWMFGGVARPTSVREESNQETQDTYVDSSEGEGEVEGEDEEIISMENMPQPVLQRQNAQIGEMTTEIRGGKHRRRTMRKSRGKKMHKGRKSRRHSRGSRRH